MRFLPYVLVGLLMACSGKHNLVQEGIKTYRSEDLTVQVDGDTTYVLSRNHESRMLVDGVDVALVDIDDDRVFDKALTSKNVEGKNIKKIYGKMMSESLGREITKQLGRLTLQEFESGETPKVTYEDRLLPEFEGLRE